MFAILGLVETLFYILAVAQILVGLYLVWDVLLWLGYVRRRLRTDPGFYAPRAAVVCSSKGLEPGLERNLIALTEFDYQNYEAVFVLASASDPAYSIVKRVAEQSKVKVHVVVAEKPEGCGEKVNNLRAAVEQLAPEFEVLVFADSDGHPGKSWLRRLVAPLSDARIAATTTMRWLIPNKSNFASLLLAAWNAPIVTMLSEKGRNFCWGGGTAIRRAVFDETGVIDEWRNSVSDDYSMTAALERAGSPIVFLPECLTPSFVETDATGLMEFTNRQILITRVYAQKLWAFAAATHFLFCLTMVLGVLVILSDLLAARPVLHLVTLAFLPLLLAAIRGAVRLAGVTEALPALRSEIMGQAGVYVVLGVFVPFLYLANIAHSLVSRKIRWRGMVYRLVSPQETKILRY